MDSCKVCLQDINSLVHALGTQQSTTIETFDATGSPIWAKKINSSSKLIRSPNSLKFIRGLLTSIWSIWFDSIQGKLNSTLLSSFQLN